jgi:RimJ/RimL family protein N-acetyltransferase
MKPLEPAPLSGVAADLVPVTEECYGYLYDLSTHPSVSVRWRYHGVIPTREAFVGEIWTGIFTQLLVVDRDTSQPAGLVVAYQGNLRNDTVWVAGVIDPRFHGRRVSLEAIFLFINYLIVTWPFRKLYMEIPEFNLSQFGSGLRRIFREEGRLREDTYYDGQYWDMVTVALYRQDLEASAIFRRVIDAAKRMPGLSSG